ncbi:hypothetical protein EJ02DRAFT_454652 [Clathrospora elynae]|uniref:GmrSD restriction endonucleases N-terminal domain-containing protein n=1 Tax=Clathrospora elynae TaxID=706981 RepID=A0A6A5STW2_9PLEO|nr:hypothetical protein EJ02DRAFT_454652 [Clathrospora elynae]
MEISATNETQRPFNGHADSNDDALQPSVKHELVDDIDILENRDYHDEGDHDEDDHDEDDYDEDDYDEGVYRPRPQLPKPQVHMRSLASLIMDLESGVIDVDPEYQREVVWTADRMTGLINSLMENYYIPPIILNEKRHVAPDGGRAHKTLVCVDGKQRLSSVRAFVKGMIPCHDHRGEKWWFCDGHGPRRKKLLSEETQKLFLDKDFVAFQFTELSLQQEEDLFARVQMGLQLSAAEKMRASTGPWQELAKLFVVDFPDVYSLMKDRARAKDFQLTLSCFSQIVEVMHPTAANGVPILKTNYAALPKFLSNKSAVDDTIKSHLAGVWTTFMELIEQDPDTFTNSNKYLQGVQTFAPVEMVAVTVLISMYSETRNNQLLLGDIKALREALRERFTDLRLNTPIWKVIWEYIEDLEAIRGAVNGTTVNRNKPEPAKTKPSIPPSVQTPKKTVTVKREKESPTLSSGTSLPKRQRTDPGPPLTQPRNGTVAFREHVPTNTNGTAQPVTQQQTLSNATPIAAIPLSAATLPPKNPGKVMKPSSTASGRRKTQIPGNNASPVSRQESGAFVPSYTDQEWGGIVKSVSPPLRLVSPLVTATQQSIPSASTTPLPAVPRQTNPKKRRSVACPTAEQYDGAIDLTSDTELELERQDLLSSFKGRSVTAKPAQGSEFDSAPM